MIIRGLTPGNMIGDRAPVQRYKGEFAECPSCGGQMRNMAKLCIDCYSKHHNTFGPIDDSEAPDRRERFDLALAAGWALVDLFKLARENKLPTRREIVARLIKRWWGPK